jgi:hypothetical protein
MQGEALAPSWYFSREVPDSWWNRQVVMVDKPGAMSYDNLVPAMGQQAEVFRKGISK